MHSRRERRADGLERLGLVACLGLSLGLGLAGCSRPQASGADAPRARTMPSEETDASGGVTIGDSRFDLHIDGMPSNLSRSELEAWVVRSATMVASYYEGRFPVPRLDVVLRTEGRGDVGFGQHWNGRRIRVRLGRDTTPEDLGTDWVMVHELLHTGFPDLPDRHRWMQEGLSTYLEPIVRARAGELSEQVVWARWTRSMHHGLPKSGDRGLDETHTWGRTYWGGTLFWLVVDVRLRTQTDNQRSIRDIVVGLQARGGNATEDWSTARVVDAADEITGTGVVSSTYDELAARPGTIDLEALWASLGVVVSGGNEVAFDDSAPLAGIRRAITSAEK